MAIMHVVIPAELIGCDYSRATCQAARDVPVTAWCIRAAAAQFVVFVIFVVVLVDRACIRSQQQTTSIVPLAHNPCTQKQSFQNTRSEGRKKGAETMCGEVCNRCSCQSCQHCCHSCLAPNDGFAPIRAQAKWLKVKNGSERAKKKPYPRLAATYSASLLAKGRGSL